MWIGGDSFWRRSWLLPNLEPTLRDSSTIPKQDSWLLPTAMGSFLSISCWKKSWPKSRPLASATTKSAASASINPALGLVWQSRAPARSSSGSGNPKVISWTKRDWRMTRFHWMLPKMGNSSQRAQSRARSSCGINQPACASPLSQIMSLQSPILSSPMPPLFSPAA